MEQARYAYYAASIVAILVANRVVDRSPRASRALRAAAFASSATLLFLPGFSADLVLAAFLALAIVGSIVISLYSEGYLKIMFGRVSPLQLIVDVSLLLFTIFLTTQRLIEFIIMWIVVELAGTLLIMLERGFRNFGVVAKYLIVCVTAGDLSLFVLLAISFAHLGLNRALVASLLDLGEIDVPLGPLTTVLLLIGFSAKLAQVPLHFWLVDTYTSAPSPGTAIFSGLLSKMAVYAIVRVQQLLDLDVGAYTALLLTQGILTAIYGFLSTAMHSDLKKVMSYSSMGYYGIMASILALLPLGGELFLKILLIYAIYHGLVKIQMFLNIASIELLTNTRDVYRLGYLAQISPRVYNYSVLAFLSLIGVPPTIGFLAKFSLLISLFALVDANPLVSAALLVTVGLTSMFAVVYSVKYLSAYTSMYKSRPIKTAISLTGAQHLSESLASALATAVTPILSLLIFEHAIGPISLAIYAISALVLAVALALRNRLVRKETRVWLGGVEA